MNTSGVVDTPSTSGRYSEWSGSLLQPNACGAPLCKDSECSARRAEPTSTVVPANPTASSTDSSTSAAAEPAAGAARQLALVTVRTGMAFIGTTSNAPPVFTSASTSHVASRCSRIQLFRLTPILFQANQSPTDRRMTLPPTTLEKLSPNARPETTWGNAVLLPQDLDKPAGLTTFPQDDDYDDGLSIMRAIQTTPANAALHVPLLTRHNPGCCPTFIPAFTAVKVIEADEARERGSHMESAIEVEHERQPFAVELQRDVIGRQ